MVLTFDLFVSFDQTDTALSFSHVNMAQADLRLADDPQYGKVLYLSGFDHKLKHCQQNSISGCRHGPSSSKSTRFEKCEPKTVTQTFICHKITI